MKGLLTHKGYNSLKSFRNIKDSEEFYNLLYKASDVLSHLTNHYYTRNDFEQDDEQRKISYQKALACQIEYFYETGQKTSVGLNSRPKTMNLGRTHITMTNHVDEIGTTVPKSIVCPDIYLYLDGTGLLDGSEDK